MDKVTSNTVIQMAGRLLQGLAAFFLLALLTRELGAEGYGRFATVYAWITLIAVVADMGLYVTGIRELSSENICRNSVFYNFLFVKIAVALGAILCTFLVLPLLPFEKIVKSGIIVTAPAVLFTATSKAFRALFQVDLKMQYPALTDTIASFTMPMICLCAFWANIGIDAVFAAFLISALISLCMLAGFSRSIFGVFTGSASGIFKTADKKIMKGLFMTALPLGLSGIMSVIYFRFDMMMLSWMAPARDVGVYGVCYTVVELGTVLPVLFWGSMLPFFTRDLRKTDRLKLHYSKSYKVMTLAAVPIFCGGCLLAPRIIRLIAGKDFISSVPNIDFFFNITSVNSICLTFMILLMVLALMFWGQLNGCLMVAAGSQKILLYAYFFLVPANVLLNIILIPRYSYMGAASATLFCEIGAILFTTWYVWKKLKLRPELSCLLFSVTASILMCIVIAVTAHYFFTNVILLILTGVVIYAIILSLLRISFLKRFVS